MDVLIFYHSGDSTTDERLHWCLESINLNSPKSIVHVLDETNERVEQFKSVYFHNSCNPEYYIKRDLARWMVYLEYCKRNGIKQFFTCDYDVLIFEEIKTRDDTDYDIQCGFGFINNMSVLEEFCDWVFWLYNTKDEGTLKDLSGDYLNDMTLWRYFTKSNNKWKWSDINTPLEDSSHDMNLCLIDGWENDGVSKSLTWIGGHPYGKFLGKTVRLKSLHCWGIWKDRMKELLDKSTYSKNG